MSCTSSVQCVCSPIQTLDTHTRSYSHKHTHTHTAIDSSVPYSQLEHHLAPPSPTSTPSPFTSLTPSHTNILTIKQLVAEALYIARPLVHSKSVLCMHVQCIYKVMPTCTIYMYIHVCVMNSELHVLNVLGY